MQPVRQKKKYPGGRTFTQWRSLPYKDRHAWVTQAQCDLLGLWVTCKKKKRCRRHRTCRGDQFACYWQRRQTLSPAQCQREGALCAQLKAMVNIGPELAE
jgi:hypothetical protein